MKNSCFLILALAISLGSFSQNNYFYGNTVNHFETVVNGSQQWRYFTGVSEPDSNWRLLSFNDATWATGNGGIGYGDNDDATVTSTCNSVYMRKQFSISDTSKITELLLSIDYDDGFVAYINNVEVARKNIGSPGVIPYYNSPAASAHEANLYRGLNAEYFFISKSTIKNLVKNGTNVLCIQVHNFTTSGTDNDLTAIPYLMAGMNTTAVVYAQNPAWFKPPFYSHMPILQLITNNAVIVNEPKKTIMMRLINNGSDQNHLTDSANDYSGKIGIELHGASSLSFPQKSYGITTYDSIANPDNVKLLDFPKESDFILYAPYNDKTLMRNVMMYDLARKMGWYAPRCRFVEVYLDTAYAGVYVLMEKIKIDKNRVGITQIKPNHNAGDSLTGGYIFKVDWNADPGLGTWNSHVTTVNIQSKTVRFQTSDPNGLDITQAQRNYIEAYLDSFEQNLLSVNMNNLVTGYRKYIDVGSFIDFFILNEITHNIDAYRASTYFFKNKSSAGGKLVMGPLWDFNYSLGNCNSCGSNDTNGWCGCTPNNTLWWFDQLNTENYYRDQLRCRWTSLYFSLLSPYNINKYIDSVAAYLEVPQLRHFVRWQILGQDLYNGHTSTAYSQEIVWMKNWYRGRSTWVNSFMPGWHNPCYESTYANRLYVTELNYNSDKNFDAGNWFEVYNNSPGAINLNNFVLSANGGTNSKKFGNIPIPAYSYMVICEDTNLFNSVYPNIRNKTGNLGFGFHNDGGKLTLYDITSYPVFTILYSADNSWPQGPNGGGKTLEHMGISTAYNSPGNWFEGCLGGSPGRAYGRCIQDVNVTEINYTAAVSHNTGDWFEIKNNGSLPKNMGGYVFKDNDDTHIFTFPANFTIGVNEYYIICADTAKFKSFHPEIKNRIGNFNFGISNKSDAIRLFTNTNTLYQSIYYTDSAAPWPSGANGTGYTIELKNDSLQCDEGGNWTIGCIYGSPGHRYHKVCNPALTAKISVSELNNKQATYADDGGWIELHNYDSLDLDLTDFTLSHALAMDTSYLFKEGIILKKNDYLLLCNDTAKFKKLHPGITKIYALNKWKFNITADSIVIKDFNKNYLVRMKYDLNLMNTEANGLGKTLELKKDSVNANLISSWFDGCFGGSPAEAYKPCSKPKLIIAELNYKSSSNFNQGSWFEIKNTDTAAINLNNYFFRMASDTLAFRFKSNLILAPNQYYAVAFDSLNFSVANPFAQNIMFLSGPGLNSKADIIQLFDLNMQLLNMQYKDSLPYPAGANGGGYTLEIINDSLNPFLASSLQTQCYGGSPGTPAMLPCNPALSSDINISEINYRSEPNSNSGFWFESGNKTNLPLPLSNWYITGSDLQKKYQLPQNIILPPKGFLVFTSDSIKFRKQYPQVSNFIFIPSNIFNASRDSIKLFDPRGFMACKAFYSDDTSWVQGANGLGYTLEKNNTIKNAIANSDWKAGCLLGSPGKAFSACVKPALIVSEINYKANTAANSGQWLELKNNTGSALNLNNYLIKFNSTDSLKINYSLGANNYLVLINDSNLFRQQYPYTTNYIFNNFKLDTLKNILKIYNNNILVNTIVYDASNPVLQQANGNGYTLELIQDTFNESLPQSWTIGCFKGSPGIPLLFPCQPALSADIIFSEINYAPDTFNNCGQWLEVFNRSNQAINLKSWVLQNGNKEYALIPSAIIPANNYWVYSNDTAAFHAIYPTVSNVSLISLKWSKTADSLSLFDYFQTLAAKAFYNSTQGWPQGANGNGRTLENSRGVKNNISLSGWKDGCILGSPGQAFINCIDKVTITEINYAPDLLADDGKWIELFISNNISANISKYIFRTKDTVISYNTLRPTKINDYFILCSDSTAFNRYHHYIKGKEQFSGLNISPGTHSLVIYDQNKSILQSVQYSSALPWDSLANGRGYTLELMKDSLNYSFANNWKSYCKRGSAGTSTISPCGNAYGLEPQNASRIPRIYPNPSDGKLNIELGYLDHLKPSAIESKYLIMNTLGQVVMAGALKDKLTTFDISMLASGIYFIQVDNLLPVKFIKE